MLMNMLVYSSTEFVSSSFCCTQDMFNWIFSFPPLSQLFLDDDNSLHEWTFRFGLDILAVPSGILCAVMLHRFPQINGWICSRSIGNNLMTILSAMTLVCDSRLYLLACNYLYMYQVHWKLEHVLTIVKMTSNGLTLQTDHFAEVKHFHLHKAMCGRFFTRKAYTVLLC